LLEKKKNEDFEKKASENYRKEIEKIKKDFEYSDNEREKKIYLKEKSC
jgi:hypothetical protein